MLCRGVLAREERERESKKRDRERERERERVCVCQGHIPGTLKSVVFDNRGDKSYAW